MADHAFSGTHTLTEPERQAFQRLLLTPGHWAALVVAPFVTRRGERALLTRSKHDLEPLDRLRWLLRKEPGLSPEARGFWDRVRNGIPTDEIELAQRLLAWHLATDLSYSKRSAFFNEFCATVGHYAASSRVPPRDQDQGTLLRELCRLVDLYLPIPQFTPNEPFSVTVPIPPPGLLKRLASSINPTEVAWSLLDRANVPARLPVTVRLFGSDIRDWWFRSDAPRWAAAHGLASHTFLDRERLYTALKAEWLYVFQSTHGKSLAPDRARRFVDSVHEWVDGVRFAARKPELWAEGPPTDPESLGPLAEPIVALPPVASRLPVARHAPPGAPSPLGDPASAVWSASSTRSAGGREIQAERIPIISPTPAVPRPPVAEPVPPRDPSIPADSTRLPASIRNAPVPPPPPPAPPPKPKRERVTATTAAPFKTVSFEDTESRFGAVAVADVCKWVDADPALLFDDCREENSRQVAIVKSEAAVPPSLWVIGDLHADVLALENIIAYADAQAGEPAHFLFLGDFVDRGTHDHETLLCLFRLLMAHPERVCVIPGNHDVDLKFDETTGRFHVTIEPAEYCDTLNAALRGKTTADDDRVKLARAFIRFCAGRPKAVFLPDGTLFAHGGFPHTDVQKDITEPKDLCKERCLDDFLWARIAETARVKRPNRASRGHEFGWDTLAQFAKIAREKLDLPVKRLVRGHDHVTDRWMQYSEYAENFVPVLTINAMGRLLDGESARRDHPHPFPVVGRYVPDHLPEVIALPLDPVEVDRAFHRTRQQRPEPGTAPAPIIDGVDAGPRSHPRSAESEQKPETEPAAPPVRDAVEEPAPAPAPEPAESRRQDAVEEPKLEGRGPDAGAAP